MRLPSPDLSHATKALRMDPLLYCCGIFCSGAPPSLDCFSIYLSRDPEFHNVRTPTQYLTLHSGYKRKQPMRDDAGTKTTRRHLPATVAAEVVVVRGLYG